ncbi:MAG: DUF2807 domain-containing protein [Bacteroidia bacterium]|nr:DUF2807 domain-containing protein [Bacteroidia bacterium]
MKTIISFKSIFSLAAAIVVSMATMACTIEIKNSLSHIEVSGVEVTHAGSLSPFDQMEVWSNVDVNFKIGDNYSYTLVADSAIIDKYEVSLSAGRLRVGIKPHLSIRWNTFDTMASLLITVPSYEAFSTLDIDLSGASRINMPAFVMSKMELDCSGASRANLSGTKISKELDIDCSGASRVETNSIEANEIKCDCSGASTIVLNGSSAKLNADCSGASNIVAQECKLSTSTTLECSGASKISLGDLTNVSASFDASGASSISYAGNPQIDHMRTSGASHVTR